MIGAGEDGRAKGLVTAALIWVAGSLGIAAGMGMWVLALMISVLALLTVGVLEWVELKVGHRDSLKGPGLGEKHQDRDRRSDREESP